MISNFNSDGLAQTHVKVKEIFYDDIIELSSSCYHILSFKYPILKPCEDVKDSINDAIDRMVVKEIISKLDTEEIKGQHMQVIHYTIK